MSFEQTPPLADHAQTGRVQGPLPVAGPVRQARKGCGFWLAALLALLFFGTTVLLLLALVASLTGGGGIEAGQRGTRFVEETLEGEGDKKILLLPITGIITNVPQRRLLLTEPGLVETVRDMLKQARKDAKISAVILSIDSPGGGITASDILYRQISDFRKEKGVPVVGLLGDVAASGGYYVASASEYIVAHPTTVTGSIGVIVPLIGIKELLAKIGVEPRPIKSGALKDIGSAYRDLTEEEEKMLQDMVDSFHQRFVSIVYEGMKLRGIQISQEELEEYCDGRVFSGTEAKKIGFVDETGYLEDAVQAARDRAGLNSSETRVVTYHRRVSLLNIIMASHGNTQRGTVTIRLQGLTDLEPPRFMYLWTVAQPGVVRSSEP